MYCGGGAGYSVGMNVCVCMLSWSNSGSGCVGGSNCGTSGSVGSS